jgi:hypothetical protein
MFHNRQLLTMTLVLAATGLAGDGPTKKGAKDASASAESARSGVLWVDPVDMESRNLLYGSGSDRRAPVGHTFTYEKEDLSGTNPKLTVHDSSGVKWKLKLGPEARPETAATRLVWAAGYFTTDNYLVPELRIEELPQHLQRGKSLIGDGTQVHNARLKRNPEGYEKAGIWKWKAEPFADQRQFNGLRVLMAVLNNWDLKDENNEILEKKKGKDSDRPERLYIVSDLGDSFGTIGLGFRHNERKGKLELYQHSKFITKTTPEYVSFSVPARPGMIILFNPREYFSRVHEEWIGRRIPRADAKWMGDLLGRLSPAQIRDAFRAGGYSAQEIDGFATVVQARIDALKNL